jgi:hypothetical protein
VNDQPDSHDEDDEPIMAVPGFYNQFGLQITREEYMAQVDQQHAQMDASAHRGVSFFDSLTEEQLFTLRGLINAMASQPESALPYYMGVVSSHLQHRFGVCPACSKKHDDEINKLIDTGRAEMSHGQADTDAEDLVGQAYAWGVDFVGLEPGQEPVVNTPVQCTQRCGATWINLADRMLAKPGPSGCPGCQQKAKFG